MEKIVWEGGSTVPPQISNKMDEKDKKYYDEYKRIVNQYSKKISLCDLDLTQDFTPPKDLYVEVRALENLKITEKSGTIRSIKKNQSYLLKRSDAENYIRIGSLVVNE
jgi:hypothetical protein